MPDATNLEVAWFNSDININDALSTASRFEGIAWVVACGKRGLGIRVPEDTFENVLVKILGVTDATKELKKYNQVIYEISKAPPWVDFDDLKGALIATWKWEVDFVRCIQRWNTKTFLVRAPSVPPHDSCEVHAHICPIQVAPPVRKQQVQQKSFTGNSSEPKIIKTTPKPLTTQVKPQARSENRLENIMLEFMSEMRNKVDCLYHRIEHVATENCTDLEDEEDVMEDDEFESDEDIEQVMESLTNPKAKKKLKRRTSGS